MADQRKPWMKWYTRDWRGKPALRMCSYAARGLWIDMLTLMAEAEHYGFLLVEGVGAPTAKQLAGLLGGTEREVAKLLKELGDANVYSVTGQDLPPKIAELVPVDMPAGVILSRRMVRDKAKADRDRTNGSGGGNPRLLGTDNRGVNPTANPQRSEARGQRSEEPAAPFRAREDRALEAWQCKAQVMGWRQAEFMTSTRRFRLAAILDQFGGLDGWDRALAKASEARFFLDDNDRPQAWFSLDWLLDGDHVARLLEGAYAERRKPAAGANTREDWNTRRIREAKEAVRQ